MRESVGSTWIFLIAITFTIIFAGFLVMALSYSRTYKEKKVWIFKRRRWVNGV